MVSSDSVGDAAMGNKAEGNQRENPVVPSFLFVLKCENVHMNTCENMHTCVKTYTHTKKAQERSSLSFPLLSRVNPSASQPGQTS